MSTFKTIKVEHMDDLLPDIVPPKDDGVVFAPVMNVVNVPVSAPLIQDALKWFRAACIKNASHNGRAIPRVEPEVTAEETKLYISFNVDGECRVFINRKSPNLECFRHVMQAQNERTIEFIGQMGTLRSNMDRWKQETYKS